MTNWRKRIGEKELAHLVSESLRVAHQTGAIKTTDLKRVTVDTTVQPKAIAFPTDAKLIYKAIVMLGREAKRHGIKLRQSYVRIGKLALIKAQRYAHAKQFKRHKKQLKLLRTRLGRVIRDISRKMQGNDALETAMAEALSLAIRVRFQTPGQKGHKIYALHAPEVECIGKGKAHKPYEFGCKVSVATTNRRSPAASSSRISKPFTDGLMTATRSKTSSPN